MCDDSLAGAALHEALLRLSALSTRISTSCMRALATGTTGAHLEPIPLLARDGVLSVALPEALGSRRHDEPV